MLQEGEGKHWDPILIPHVHGVGSSGYFSWFISFKRTKNALVIEDQSACSAACLTLCTYPTSLPGHLLWTKVLSLIFCWNKTEMSILLLERQLCWLPPLGLWVVLRSCLAQSGSSISISRLLWRGAALTWIFHCICTVCNGMALPQLHRNWGTLLEMYRWSEDKESFLWPFHFEVYLLTSQPSSARNSWAWALSALSWVAQKPCDGGHTWHTCCENWELKSCKLKIWLSETRPRVWIYAE